MAFFDPVLPHYRGALVRRALSSERFEYRFFSDPSDVEGEIPAIDKSNKQIFIDCKTRRLPIGMYWQSNTIKTCVFKGFDAAVLPGNARWLSSWLGAICCRLTKKKVLFWSHGWTREDKGLVRWVRIAFYRLSHGLLLYGDRAREIGVGFGFDPNRMHVMYNSIDSDQQIKFLSRITVKDRRDVREELFGEPDTPVVIISGRLTKVKNFDLAIRAIDISRRSGHQVNLLVVGDGPELAHLRALAEEMQVPARFVGACYDEEKLARYFCCASLTVSPGNVGLTCMHSMGYGVPVITHGDHASQNPEWEAIKPGRNGDLFEKGRVEQIAALITAWTVRPEVSPEVALCCLRTISERYTPTLQFEVVERALLRR